MDTLLTAFTLLLPPSIALMGCYRKKIIDMQLPLWLHYLSIATILFLFLTLELWSYEIIAMEVLPYHARKSLLLATLQACCYPAVHEFIQKYVHIKVEINEAQNNKQ